MNLECLNGAAEALSVTCQGQFGSAFRSQRRRNQRQISVAFLLSAATLRRMKRVWNVS